MRLLWNTSQRFLEQNINSKVQYLYCDAYLDFYRGNPEAAAAKASTISNYPVDRWRKRFEAILAQVEEIKGGQTGVTDDKDPTAETNRNGCEVGKYRPRSRQRRNQTEVPERQFGQGKLLRDGHRIII